MSRRNGNSSYPIERRRNRREKWPLGARVNPGDVIDNPRNPANNRRLHGTDPLQDGFDPGEDPLRRKHRRRKKPEL